MSFTLEQPALPASEVEALRPLMGLGWLDDYQVRRETVTSDNAGGTTSTVATVETSRGRLRRGGAGGGLTGAEQEVAARLGWASFYALDMPAGTVLTPADRLLVNAARTFEVGEVLKDGRLGLYATAILREVG